MVQMLKVLMRSGEFTVRPPRKAMTSTAWRLDFSVCEVGEVVARVPGVGNSGRKGGERVLRAVDRPADVRITAVPVEPHDSFDQRVGRYGLEHVANPRCF